MEEQGSRREINREAAGTAVASLRGRPRGFDIDKALKVATKIFWKKGYPRTTMMDICNAVGIKPPSFYRAFGSKEELFLKTLDYYVEFYWDEVFESFLSEPDVNAAFRKLFDAAVKIYTRPNLPKGCFIDISTIGLPESEARILGAIAKIQARTKGKMRKRLLMAIEAGQLSPDCNVGVMANAMYAFLKGVAASAREDMCQAELNEIANLGARLLSSKP